MVSTQPSRLYNRTGELVYSPKEIKSDNSVGGSDSGHTKILTPNKNKVLQIARQSLLQKAYLKGILQTPRDVLFLARLLTAGAWAMIRLHCIELPYLIVTFYKYPTKQHVIGWPWWLTITMSFIRAAASQIHTIGHLRFVGLFVETFFPLQALLQRNVKVDKNVQFRVQLDNLLQYERASVALIRKQLRENDCSDDVMNPSLEYLESMHLPSLGPESYISNIPEEVGTLDEDGSYILKGEWIEASYNKNETRPRSDTVMLYFHGGGHGFLSPATHREYLCRLAKQIGPGTRIFSLDYRLGPEHPFPAAIHDAFAGYLYLTEPNHKALVLDSKKSFVDRVPVDPRNIVVGGDSAGANLAAAFMIYMKDYVQPSTSPKFVLPHATILISVWSDPTSSLPTAQSNDCYCYCPGPLGAHPFSKTSYMDFKIKNRINLASNYVCGDSSSSPNPRNALGVEREWLWYSHLAQHPLVSPVHRASLAGLGNTLVHTGTHDRLIDDCRLFAHRLGKENPDKMMRIEVYKNMTHVHHVFPLLKLSGVALKNISRFIERSKQCRDIEEGLTSKTEYIQGLYKGMVKERSTDGAEWALVDQDGKEKVGDEGWPMDVLINSWPSNQASEV